MTFNYGNGNSCGCGSNSCCCTDSVVPGGNTKDVQYNLNGAFGGNDNYQFDGSTVFAPSEVLNNATGGYKGPGTINATGYYLNGVPLSTGGGGSTPPADPVNSVQFNNAGSFGGSQMLYDATNNSLLGGSGTNTLSGTAANSVIVNGSTNTIDTTYSDNQPSYYLGDFIGAGFNNAIYDQADGGSNVVVGGNDNKIGVVFANVNPVYNNFIGGGYYNVIADPLDADGVYTSSIVGGDSNTLWGHESFIGGGYANNITQGNRSFIGAGENNIIYPVGEGSTYGCVITGGSRNSIGDSYGFIGSGEDNINVGGYNFVGTGRVNQNLSNDSFIGSGFNNTTSQSGSFIGAGSANAASGYQSAVVAGINNAATTDNSTVFGANGIARVATPGSTGMTQVTQGTNNFFVNVGLTDKGTSQTSTLVLAVSSAVGAVSKGISFQPSTTTYIEATFVGTSSFSGGQFAKFKRAAMVAFDGATVENLTLDTDIGNNSGAPPAGWTATMANWYTEGVLLTVTSNDIDANWVITMQMTEVIMSQV